MIDIIGKKKWYFLFSLLMIVPGTISLLLYGLSLSIDFTGGSRMSLLLPKEVKAETTQRIRDAFKEEKVAIATLQPAKNEVFIRTAPLSEKQHKNVLTKLKQKIGTFKEESFETIGPVVGQETTFNALKAIVISSVLIVLYIAWSFRSVPKPASSWRFGVTTIATLLHDVLLLVGVFSLLGKFFHIEVDSLFLTAVLTVMGFSVHDTIVVFDRVRENLQKGVKATFAQSVNDAILQTFVRSLNTSLTAMLVLLALLLFGGESARWFVVALLIGIASGTYSSIFNAAPLLVAWQEWDEKRKLKGQNKKKN